MKRFTSAAADAVTFGFEDESPSDDFAAGISGELSPDRKRKVFSDYASPRRKKKKKVKRTEGLSPSQRTSSPVCRKEGDVLEDGRRIGEQRECPPLQNESSYRRGEELTPVRRKRPLSPVHDLSPARRRKDESSLEDLSPPRQRRTPEVDLSPPRRRGMKPVEDLSPPRRGGGVEDLSPPRRRQVTDGDLSPPRRSHVEQGSRREEHVGRMSADRKGEGSEVRRSAKMLDGAASGLRSDKEIKVTIERKRNAELKRLAAMDASESGRGAETIYRDKRGRRMEGLEELLRQQEGAKKVEKPLEWGKGLAQKREAEIKQRELDEEASKPFARSRDDPDLDKALRERVRWGDPMAHLVKQAPEPKLEDFSAREDLKESGFYIPQDIPAHSWITRRIAPPSNRYGIKPGRHWDGVDRSTGFEKDLVKQQNERVAREKEAYLWSVADM